MGEITIWNDRGDVLLDIRRVQPERREAGMDGLPSSLSLGEPSPCHKIEYISGEMMKMVEKVQQERKEDDHANS
jgi:hypothetical protein